MVKASPAQSSQESIINCLDRTMASRPIYTHGQFHQALEAQAQNGWERMLQGYWTQEWQVAYKATYNTPTEEEQKDKTKCLLYFTSHGTMAKEHHPNSVGSNDKTLETPQR
jgi:hypothetical protein